MSVVAQPYRFCQREADEGAEQSNYKASKQTGTDEGMV